MKKTLLLLIGIICFGFVQGKETINASTILEKISKHENVIINNATIIGDLDFTKFDDKQLQKKEFSNTSYSSLEEIYDRTSDHYLVNINSKIEFTNCDFKGKLIGYSVNEEENTVLNANFNQEIKFHDCHFYNDLLFNYAVFNENVEITNSNIDKAFYFKFAEFNDYTCFSNTNFGCCGNFSMTVFNESVCFSYCRFAKTAAFNNTTFNELAEFRYTLFGENANFVMASFKEENFNRALFKSAINFSHTEFENLASFKNSRFHDEANFTYANIKENIDLNQTSFKTLPDFSYTIVGNKYLIQKLTEI